MAYGMAYAGHGVACGRPLVWPTAHGVVCGLHVVLSAAYGMGFKKKIAGLRSTLWHGLFFDHEPQASFTNPGPLYSGHLCLFWVRFVSAKCLPARHQS